MPNQEYYREKIPGASEYVQVRREDLEWIVSLTDRKSQDAKYSPKFLRLKMVVEEKVGLEGGLDEIQDDSKS